MITVTLCAWYFGSSTWTFNPIERLASRGPDLNLHQSRQESFHAPSNSPILSSARHPRAVVRGLKLKMLNADGTIRAVRDLSSHNDPRFIHCSDRYVLYDWGEWPMENLKYVQNHPYEMSKWMQETRMWSLFDLHSHEEVRARSEALDGIPIELGAETISCLRINNLEECLKHILDHRASPKISIELTAIGTGDLKQCLTLNFSADDAWKIVTAFCQVKSLGETKIDCRLDGVLTLQVFGQAYLGKWQTSPTQ